VTGWTLAKTENVICGHGDFADRTTIEKSGMYWSGDFPKIFLCKEKAEVVYSKELSDPRYSLVEMVIEENHE